MCLFPKLIKNPKYKPNKKNGWNVPQCEDQRTQFVPIACGVCYECMKKKASEWRIRLNEELKATNKNCIFVTLTFSDEELQKLCTEKETTENNAIATIAVRRFLERHRKHKKKSIRHWLVTEMGHKKPKKLKHEDAKIYHSERIHLHGLLWDITKEELEKFWKYGNIWIGEYVNNKTINYILKYVTKIDKEHKNFRQIILCSKGIGKNYIENPYSLKHKYNESNTNENYTISNGAKIAMPIYYKNYLYTEKEREKLWIKKLDKQERYILGQKIDVSNENGEKLYYEMLENAQKINKKLGYGDDSKEWKKKSYNVTNRILNDLTKQKKILEKINKNNFENSKKNT